MEVTNTNTNQFAPKLGQPASDTFSSDAFSAHLAETDTFASDNADTRADERASDADDRRADDRQADADKAAAEEDRRAEERDRDAAASDDDDTANSEEQTASKEDSDLEFEDVETGTAGLTDENGNNAEELEATVTTEEVAAGDTVETDANAVPGTDTGETIASGDTKSKSDETTPLAAATDADETEDAVTSADNADDLTADELALQSAQASSGNSTANADATAGASAQQAARPAANATSQATQQASQTATGTQDQSTGLPNPLDAGLQSDVDADADGERGLGHQAAEAMAGKSKSSATNTPTPAAQQAVTAPSPAPVAAVTPLQALAAAGLNLSALPSDLNLDLLNLNGTNQVTQAGTPQNNNPVLVRFGALPGQAQATQVPNTAIALQISKHIARGISTFQIRLDPAEMGRVDVKLELAQDGRVTAHLAVEKSETLDLLQRDAKALEQALKDAGLDADNETLSFSLKDGNSGNAESGDAEHLSAGNDQQTGDDEAEDVLMNAVAARQIEAAARGGIDVSI